MSVGNFVILALMNSTQATTMLWCTEISRKQVLVGPHWSRIGSQTKSESRLQAIMEKYLGRYFVRTIHCQPFPHCSRLLAIAYGLLSVSDTPCPLPL